MSGNKLFAKEHFDIPDELVYTPQTHSEGLVKSRVNVKIYPQAPTTNSIKPKSQVTFRIVPDDLALDMTSLTFHMKVKGLSTANFAHGYFCLPTSAQAMISKVTLGFNGAQTIETLEYYNYVAALERKLLHSPGNNESWGWKNALNSSGSAQDKFNTIAISNLTNAAPVTIAEQKIGFNNASHIPGPYGDEGGGAYASVPDLKRVVSVLTTVPAPVGSEVLLSSGVSRCKSIRSRDNHLMTMTRAGTTPTQHFSFQLQGSGLADVQQLLWGHMVGSVDITFDLANGFESSFGYRPRADYESTDAFLIAEQEKMGWEVSDFYATAEMVELSSKYIDRLLQQLNSKQGVQLDMATYKCVQRTELAGNENNTKDYHLQMSLSSVNSVFVFWKDVNEVNPSVLNANGQYAGTDGTAFLYARNRVRNDDKTGSFKYPSLCEYQVMVNGQPITAHSIKCTGGLFKETQNFSEAWTELEKALGIHNDNSHGSSIEVQDYFRHDHIGSGCFVIGQRLNKSSLRSGKSMKSLLLRFNYLSNEIKANGGANDVTLSRDARLKNYYVLLIHDKRVVIHSGRQFAVYE